jgi:hypothetical protein
MPEMTVPVSLAVETVLLDRTFWCGEAGHDKVWRIKMLEIAPGVVRVQRIWGARKGSKSYMEQVMEQAKGEAVIAKLIAQKQTTGRSSGTYMEVAPQVVGFWN